MYLILLKITLWSITINLNINDIIRVASNVTGVLAVITPVKDIITINTFLNNRIDESGNFLEYNNNNLNVIGNLNNGLLFPSPGGIFELKHSSKDINIRGT